MDIQLTVTDFYEILTHFNGILVVKLDFTGVIPALQLIVYNQSLGRNKRMLFCLIIRNLFVSKINMNIRTEYFSEHFTTIYPLTGFMDIKKANEIIKQKNVKLREYVNKYDSLIDETIKRKQTKEFIRTNNQKADDMRLKQQIKKQDQKDTLQKVNLEWPKEIYSELNGPVTHSFIDNLISKLKEQNQTIQDLQQTNQVQREIIKQYEQHQVQDDFQGQNVNQNEMVQENHEESM